MKNRDEEHGKEEKPVCVTALVEEWDNSQVLMGKTPSKRKLGLFNPGYDLE